MDNNILIMMLLGAISTTVLHLAKAMERYGIEVFDQIRAKFKKQESGVEGGTKKPIVYLIGAILNNTIFIFIMVANVLAPGTPATYYTSMFGLGLITLMIFSTKVLKEPIQRIEIFGAIILIGGTIILGIDGTLRKTTNASSIDTTLMFYCFLIFVIISGIGIGIAYKKGSPLFIGIIFGLIAGGFGVLDPFMKNIAQNQGISGSLLPTTLIGWIIFIPSFVMGTASFLVTQMGFARKAPASVLVPCYNSMYVVLPILIQAIALPDFNITSLTIIGIGVTIIGIVLMQVFKKNQGNPHQAKSESISEIPVINNPEK